MKRGDLVTIALQGDFGKPRPALIIQSDLFNEHPSITIVPVTGELLELSLFRITVNASKLNGLSKPSQIMIDKPQTVTREKVGATLGRLEDELMLSVNRALAVFLGFA